MNIPDHIESLKQFFGLKMLKVYDLDPDPGPGIYDADPDPGSGIFLTLDPGWKISLSEPIWVGDIGISKKIRFFITLPLISMIFGFCRILSVR
jgi:hypothetical protein